MNLPEKDQHRFLSKVALPNENGCMLWLDKPDHYGYGQIALAVDGRQNGRAHRLSYELFVGPVPAGLDVEHRCGVRLCVAPNHLRAATRKQNNENLGGARRTSKSGVRGVSWSKPHGRWTARVGHHGRQLYLGLFDTIEEADAAARTKRAELYTHNDREMAGL